jgi:chromosome partitioning protein
MGIEGWQPGVTGVAGTSLVGTYRRIAEVIRSAQRAAIEVENAPEKRKRLRTFSAQEVAALLGVQYRDITSYLKSTEEKGSLVRTRLTLDDVIAMRHGIFEKTGSLDILPWRRPAQGEGIVTVVFSNFKGGSAKTTSSVHFAQYLARAGYRVLLIDLDSQASATAQFGLDPSSEVGVANSFAGWTAARDEGRTIPAASICQRTYWSSIDLVSAGAVLAQAEEALARRSSNREVESVLYFDELNSFLSALGDAYDVAVVDTRPDVNMLMTIALHAASCLIVPTRATMTDLASTGEFFAHLDGYVRDFEAAFGSSLPTCFTKLMITAYDPTDRSQEALASLIRERFGESVLPGEFLHSRIMGTAGFGKETLYEYEPSTDRAAYNRVLASANSVHQAIEGHIRQVWGRGETTTTHDRAREVRE